MFELGKCLLLLEGKTTSLSELEQITIDLA